MKIYYINILKNLTIAALMILDTHGQAMDQNKKAEDKKPVLSLADKTLIIAAHMGNESAAKIALDRGARINAQNEDGHTALYKAVIKQRRPNDIKYVGAPLYIWEFHERPELVQLLMRAGADCTIKDARGISPLAVLSCERDSCFEFSRTGYSPRALNIMQHILRTMHHCTKMAHDPQETLGEITYNAAHATRNKKLNNKDIDKHYTLLNDSLRAGSDMTCMIGMYQHDTINGMAKNFNDKRMQALIATFQKEHSDQIGQALQPVMPTALHPIIFECLYPQPQKEVMTGYCKELLTIPLNTLEIARDVRDKFNRFQAVEGDTYNARDNQGNTALHLAVKQGDLKIVQCMRPRNLDDSINAYQLALHHRHNAIARHLFIYIAEAFLDSVGNNDDSLVLKLVNLNLPIGSGHLIRFAISRLGGTIDTKYNKRFEIIKILLASGSEPDIDNQDYWLIYPETCLEAAVSANLPDLVKLLLYLGADPKRPNLLERTGKIPSEQTNNPKIKTLLQDPKATLENLTESEKREFADIKAEREKRLKTFKEQG